MRRIFASLAVALVIALTGVATFPDPSYAAVTVPLDPVPVNVLPSVVKGAFTPIQGMTSVQSAQAAKLMYTYLEAARDPATLAALKKTSEALPGSPAGLTAAEETLITQTATKTKVPWTTMTKLAKVGGGVGAALSVFQVGTMIGNGVTQVVGIGSAGEVCASATGVAQTLIALATGNDCGQFNKDNAWQPNTDVTAGSVGASMCTPAGNCTAWQSVKRYITGFGGTNEYEWITTFSMTGPTVSGNNYADFAYCAKGYLGTGVNLSCAAGGEPQLGLIRSSSRNECAAVATGVTNAWCRIAFSASADAIPINQEIERYWAINSPRPTTSSITTTAGNPSRNFKCVIASATSTYTALSPSFSETDTTLPVPVCPSLPSGEVPLTQKITETGTGTTEKELQSLESTPEYKEAHQLYPECADSKCLTILQFKDGSKWKSCFDNVSDCEGWFQDPDRDTNYRCKYGTHVVDLLKECIIYKPTFEKTNNPLREELGTLDTGTVINNENVTVINNHVTKITQGGTIVDPVTGNQGECFPTGWGVLNPISWVLQPIGCALNKAFIPTATGLTQVEAQRAAVLDGTAIGQVSGMGTAIIGAFDVGSGGCKGPPMRIKAFGVDEAYYPMDACDEPMAGVASAINGCLAFSLVVMTIISATRYIAGTIGFVGWAANGGPDQNNSAPSGPTFK